MVLETNMAESESVHWMRRTLQIAAGYNIAWGLWVITRPYDLFDFASIPRPLYPGIWQCVGMIVGVYGVGYWIASRDPLRHWPITFVGLLGKIFGPIGFVWTYFTIPAGEPGHLPAAWALTLITNDLVWWIPFGGILIATFRAATRPPGTEVMPVAQANASFRTNHGATIASLSSDASVMVVFLRHSGCTFCRQALEDLAKRRDELSRHQIIPVVVHMSSPESADALFASYGLVDLHRISDPECQLYRAYELPRSSIAEMFHPVVWWRGFVAAIVQRHGVGKLDGDGFQMPGMFLVRNNTIVKAYRHERASDRPDVCQIAISP